MAPTAQIIDTINLSFQCVLSLRKIQSYRCESAWKAQREGEVSLQTETAIRFCALFDCRMGFEQEGWQEPEQRKAVGLTGVGGPVVFKTESEMEKWRGEEGKLRNKKNVSMQVAAGAYSNMATVASSVWHKYSFFLDCHLGPVFRCKCWYSKRHYS